MGLLDSFLGSSIEDPKTQATMAAIQGLLAAPRNSVGALSNGLLAYGGSMAQAKQQAAQQQMQQLQMQQHQLALQQAQRAMQRQDALEALPAQFMGQAVKPDTMDNRDVGQPGEQAVKQGPFDMAGYAQAMFKYDPKEALALQQYLRKDTTPIKLGAGEALIDPVTLKPLANNPKDEDPSEVKAYKFARAQGYPGTYQQFVLEQKKAGATNVTLSTEKDYAGKIAGGLADRDLQAIDAAKAAPDTIASSQRIRQILASNQAFTGTGAETRLAITKALSTAGLVNGNSVTATEDLQRELSQGVLGHIKSSGLGGGSGFSNADRDFLEKAAAGKIDVNAQTLAKTAELAERAARKSIDAGNQALKRVRSAPGVGTIPMMPDIAQPGSNVIDFSSLK